VRFEFKQKKRRKRKERSFSDDVVTEKRSDLLKFWVGRSINNEDFLWTIGRRSPKLSRVGFFSGKEEKEAGSVRLRAREGLVE
jgi:hypothetical protein